MDYTGIVKSGGRRWYRTKDQAKGKAPKGSQGNAMNRAAKYGVGKQRERYGVQAMALQHQADRVTDLATCSGCGRHEYDEYKPGQAPPETTPSPPSTPPPPPPAQPAQWSADPTGRHELRYWTGTAWSEHVSDAGTQSVDPV